MIPRVPTLFAVASVALCTFEAEWRSEPWIAQLSSPSPSVASAGAGAGPDASAVPNPHASGLPIEHFMTAAECAVCHIAAPGASAMKDGDDNDVSPYFTWQASLMANAFRDPYFRAQLEKESAAAGEAAQELCLRCHTPLVHHEAKRDGRPLPRLATAVEEMAADDGVSCTACHMMSPDKLGEPESYSGLQSYTDERVIYGPFDDVLAQPMQSLVAYTPKKGEHIRSSAMCATCHTLHTEHHGAKFAEQTPYYEWRNSEFNDEREGHDPDKTRSCQECHMPEVGTMRIARSPMGFDFRGTKPREGVRSHAFIGGNALMLDLLREHGDELYVEAEPEQFEALAAATRHQLRHDTATVAVSELARVNGRLDFSIDVQNLTGHKFPTGYPSRRAWLHIEVMVGSEVVFVSGAHDASGRLRGVDDALAIPHVQRIEKPADVQVYEMVAVDAESKATTHLTKMVARQKDNRLLPRGYESLGPHVEDIAPKGADGDGDFVGGGDRVACSIPLPADAPAGACRVVVRMLYQPVPPRWVDALRDVDGEAARRFVGYYDAKPRAPELVAEAERVE
ncbi:MAG: multiheme c-type cytochrome [Planctomycetota bacterium]